MEQSQSATAMFIGHGSPLNAIIRNDYTETLAHLGRNISKNINSIVCISAHWNTEGIFITGAENLKTIYDFSGFPDELYQIKYAPKGNPKLAQEMQLLLKDYSPQIDFNRGLDHGAWSVLVHMFPKVDIPVLQLSLNLNFRTADHYKLALLLKPLRKEGILFLGTGNIVHSFFSFDQDINAPSPQWAIDFDLNIKKALIERDHNSIIRYRRIFGRSAKLSVPTEEHYLPLLYIIALQEEAESVNFIYEKFQNSGMSMRSFTLNNIEL
ncbi:dioxygenase [Silvanigrella aquatica]|uniref:Extradiol ring-cleavage dioxygenase class III enzyme subunit B domain-containing protein n=1 Tax=Silvanigrella aquatica TaxID=1915309 RepID=A0A1L4D098_9BACT|nr:class III extradiol ring-cleavage dioxygenase [Silvanigrella aquatica]APJ03632.1 hypothetical protein AXG55_06815 [Silvanigrella aquatica]